MKSTTQLPSIEGICKSQKQLSGYITETPLINSPTLSYELQADVWIKDETVSPIHCFKHRGALTHLLRARESTSITAAVTSSTGNHGLGVAYAAKRLGVPAHIFLPTHASSVKLKAIQELGATIHLTGADIDDAKETGRAFARQPGYTFVDDGESMDVIEGAGTVGLEIAQALNHIDAVFIPMGSGSLGSGNACAIKSISPQTQIICVQSSGARAMAESFRQQRPVELPINTIADGLVCRKPAKLALECLLAFINDVKIVHDVSILSAVHILATRCKLLTEPSGAAGLAALRTCRHEFVGKRVVIIVTGANVSSDLLEDLNYAKINPSLTKSPVQISKEAER